jgi:hypothetical protein
MEPLISRLLHELQKTGPQNLRENATVAKKNDEHRAIDACLREHQFPFSTSDVVSQCCIVCADVYVRVMSISQLRPRTTDRRRRSWPSALLPLRSLYLLCAQVSALRSVSVSSVLQR